MTDTKKLFEISHNIFCEVSVFQNKVGVDIRKWFEKEGVLNRTQKGIWLKPEEWESFVEHFEMLKTYVTQKLEELKGK